MAEAKRRADLMRAKGNFFLDRAKVDKAIDAYTEAITLCPSVPVYWTNRAFAERQKDDECEWKKVEADCRKALELDGREATAHCMLGLALQHDQQYEEAIVHLEKALDLRRDSSGAFSAEVIWKDLSETRFSEWVARSDIRIMLQYDLKSTLDGLLTKDFERQLNDIVDDFRRSPLSYSILQQIPGISPNSVGANRLVTAPFNPNVNPDVSQFTKILRTISEPPIILLNFGSQQTPATMDLLKELKQSRCLQRAKSFSVACLGGILKIDRDEGSDSVGEGSETTMENAPELGIKAEKSRHQESGEEAEPKSGEEAEQLSSEEVELEIRKEAKQKIPEEAKLEFRETSEPEIREVSELDSSSPFVSCKDERKASSSSSTRRQGGIDGSIPGVYKVFKEFMKCKYHVGCEKLLTATETYQRRKQLLMDLFETTASQDKREEFPDHLCCKITMDLFRDPVITTSGITYERAAILDHLKKVGEFDPVTRAPLKAVQLVPNLAIKETVQIYLNEHGWAYGPWE